MPAKADGPEVTATPDDGAASPRSYSTFLAVTSAVVFLIEVAIVWAVASDRIAPATGLLSHATVVVALGALTALGSGSRRNTGAIFLLAVLTLVLGPLGSIGIVTIRVLARIGRQNEALLAAWYDRISLSTEMNPVARLAENIAIGRTIDLGAPEPESFAAVFEYGTLAEQQNALGLIARNFHPSYLPGLQLALASDVPVVRVQAAAVAAHIRKTLIANIEAALDRAQAPNIAVDEAMTAIVEAEQILNSGLVDETARLRLEHVAASSRARIMAAIENAASRKGAAALRLADNAANAYADHLIATLRFDEFRRYRMRERRTLFGRYVFRRARWRGMRQARLRSVSRREAAS
jgi:hypothetical protein